MNNDFEWDPAKAKKNLRKHGVSFELATSVFHDPHILSVPDLDHSEDEERWFSVGTSASGKILSVAYLWSESDTRFTKIRLISAREAAQSERRTYEENL